MLLDAAWIELQPPLSQQPFVGPKNSGTAIAVIRIDRLDEVLLPGPF